MKRCRTFRGMSGIKFVCLRQTTDFTLTVRTIIHKKLYIKYSSENSGKNIVIGGEDYGIINAEYGSNVYMYK